MTICIKTNFFRNMKKHQKNRSLLSFREKVFEVVRKIPKGETLTYKQVAEKIGSSLSARAVGNALHSNLDPKIPCHRVIRSDGKLGGYNRGAERKKGILKKEGISC